MNEQLKSARLAYTNWNGSKTNYKVKGFFSPQVDPKKITDEKEEAKVESNNAREKVS